MKKRLVLILPALFLVGCGGADGILGGLTGFIVGGGLDHETSSVCSGDFCCGVGTAFDADLGACVADACPAVEEFDCDVCETGNHPPENRPPTDRDPPADDAGDGTGDDGEAGDNEPGEHGPDDRVTICHRPECPLPPGEQPAHGPREARTIEVPESAVQAHLDHNDVLGACP